MRRYCVFAFVVALSAWARADSPPITLLYDAPWECPDRDQFWRQLRGRSVRLAAPQGEVRGIAIETRISGSFDRYNGHLRLLESDGSVVERDVAGPSCVDVSAALALITAVTLDASRSRGQRDVSATALQKKAPKRLALGVSTGIDKAVAPSVVPTLGLSLTYHDRAGFGSPEYRVAGLFAWSGWNPVDDAGVRVGDVRFYWLASRSTACPLQAQVASTTIGPCAFVELGALMGEGRIHNGTQSKTGFWLAPGALLNWSFQTDPIGLRLAAGAVVPVVRDKFSFNPKPLAFQADSIGLTAELEVAWAF